jgi:futalosine hydrolase
MVPSPSLPLSLAVRPPPPRQPLDVLLLAAFDPELAPLRRFLGEGLAARVGERGVAARAAGVGMVAAAAGAAAPLGEFAPRAVVLIGSCGAYTDAPSPLALGDVAIGRRFRLADLAAIDGLAQYPPPMVPAMEADARLSDAIAQAGVAPPSLRATACIATTLAITVDDGAAARLAARTGADVEHLETHGVATACAARGVPFAVVLGVANFVGSRGRTEWLEHHGRAEAAAAERVIAWLEERSGARDP